MSKPNSTYKEVPSSGTPPSIRSRTLASLQGLNFIAQAAMVAEGDYDVVQILRKLHILQGAGIFEVFRKLVANRVSSEQILRLYKFCDEDIQKFNAKIDQFCNTNCTWQDLTNTNS